MKLCPACSGTGFAPENWEMVECPLCYGVGEVAEMGEDVVEGTIVNFGDRLKIYTDGEWVVYEPPKIFKGMVF